MSEQPVADRSVRIAWAADVDALSEVQARAWQRTYGSVLPSAVLEEIDATAFAEAWTLAISRPPTARHRVLVAHELGRVVGFVATAPSEDPDAEPTDGEIVAFHVDPDALGEGHGSRLLAAAIDTLRADDFSHARIWLVVGDDDLRRFLEPAGFATDSAHRTLDLTGDGSATLRQIRLHTDLREGTADSPVDGEA